MLALGVSCVYECVCVCVCGVGGGRRFGGSRGRVAKANESGVQMDRWMRVDNGRWLMDGGVGWGGGLTEGVEL